MQYMATPPPLPPSLTELVGSYAVPLCSDAGSQWVAANKNAHTHNLEVRLQRALSLLRFFCDELHSASHA
jgi:hypothetical protein